MRRRLAIPAAIIAPLLTAASCGYPDFSYGPTGSSGSGGSGTTSSGVSTSGGGSTASSASTASGSSPTSSSTSAGGGMGGAPSGCPIGHLLISEVRTRGVLGADDEFVEIFNPTDADVLLDSTWTLQGRKAGVTTTYSAHWTGAFQTIRAHGYLLLAGSGYTQKPDADDHLSLGLTDAASLVLQQVFTPIDTICFYNSAATQIDLEDFLFTCEGTPVLNPHDDSDGTDTNSSLERRKGGGVYDCTDSDDNALDFVIQTPATPASSMTPAVP